jgi:hypothetical protein
LFSKDKEAIDEAIWEAERHEDLEDQENIELEDKLAERLKKAQASGWRSIGPLGKLHNIAVNIRSSEQRYNEFKAKAGRSLGLDNDTRWNSWYIMLTTGLKLQSAINAYAEKYYSELGEDYLSPAEWRVLEDTAAFLQPFYRATLETEGDLATLDRSLYTMDILIKHFEKAQVKSSYFLRLPLTSETAPISEEPSPSKLHYYWLVRLRQILQQN